MLSLLVKPKVVTQKGFYCIRKLFAYRSPWFCNAVRYFLAIVETIAIIIARNFFLESEHEEVETWVSEHVAKWRISLHWCPRIIPRCTSAFWGRFTYGTFIFASTWEMSNRKQNNLNNANNSLYENFLYFIILSIFFIKQRLPSRLGLFTWIPLLKPSWIFMHFFNLFWLTEPFLP